MCPELNNDMDYFVGAFEELMQIAVEAVRGQPVMQFDCISVVLTKQLHEIRDRVFELNRSSSSLASDVAG